MQSIHTKRILRCFLVIVVSFVLLLFRGLICHFAARTGFVSLAQDYKISEEQCKDIKLQHSVIQTDNTSINIPGKDIFKDMFEQYVKENNKEKRNTSPGSVRLNGNGMFVRQKGDTQVLHENGSVDDAKQITDTQNSNRSIAKDYKGSISFESKQMKLGVEDKTSRNEKGQDSIAATEAKTYSISDNEKEIGNRVINKHGLQLAEEVRNVCSSERVISNTPSLLHYIYDDRTLYCPVEKIGTTFWRRIVYIFSSKNPDYKFPFDVPEEFVHIRVKKVFSRQMSSKLPNTAFSFLFVRNPFTRLLSAFIDKIVAPNPYYWREFGNLAIRRYRQRGISSHLAGHSITFSEFIKLVSDVESTTMYSDPHIKSIDNNCNPCLLNYTFIGRMESFKGDALYVLRKLNTKQDIVKSIEKEWKDLSIEAAIKFNIEYCFNSKKEIMNYITWEKALQRLWLHLQMRGLISKNYKLYHPKKNINILTEREFVDLAVKANKASNEKELKIQKLAVQREAFASVDIADLERFIRVFRKDFELFGYDSHPSFIFQRESVKPLFFNYSSLN